MDGKETIRRSIEGEPSAFRTNEMAERVCVGPEDVVVVGRKKSLTVMSYWLRSSAR